MESAVSNGKSTNLSPRSGSMESTVSNGKSTDLSPRNGSMESRVPNGKSTDLSPRNGSMESTVSNGKSTDLSPRNGSMESTVSNGKSTDLSPRNGSMESTVSNGKSASKFKFNGEGKVDTAAACDVIYNTLKALKFHPRPNYDDSCLADSDAYWDSLQDIDGATKARILKVAKGCVAMGDLVYPFLEKRNRLALGIYTTYLVWLDDGAPTEDLKVFRKYCTSDRSKLSIAMQHMADYFDTFTSYYGPHAGDSIWSATFQFLNSIIVEENYLKGIAIPRSAKLFPDYQRLKCGIAETYAWTPFCQAELPEEDWLMRELLIIPDLIEFFNCGNDLISFYKEHVIGEEKFTYIWNYSDCHDIPLLEGLKNIARRVLNSVERMRTTSAGQPELLSKVEELVQGYMQWHWYFNERYHLQEMYKLQNYSSTI